MTEVNAIAAEPRDVGRKSQARAVRLSGRIPGVIYGGKGEPVAVSFDAKELTKLWKSGTFQSHVLSVSLAGKTTRTVPRDVQLDPVTDSPIHVDMMRVEAGTRIRIAVPVRFVNEGLSPGIKRGGVLNIVRHDIEVTCPAEAIPEAITADLAPLDINDSLHISAIALPAGVKPTISGRNFTIASIVAPSGLTSEREEAKTEEAVATTAAPAAGAAAPAAAAPAKGGAQPAKGAAAAPAKAAAPSKKG